MSCISWTRVIPAIKYSDQTSFNAPMQVAMHKRIWRVIAACRKRRGIKLRVIWRSGTRAANAITKQIISATDPRFAHIVK